jgi:hypothetical protein
MKRRARIITRLYKAQRDYEWLMDERNGYLVRGRRIR